MPRVRFIVPVLLCAAGISAWGQGSTSGTLVGSVMDATQAAVPAAQITLTQKNSAATRMASPNSAGLFQFTSLLPGAYSLKVVAPGFKTLELDGISLSNAEIRNLGDLTLQIGAVADNVTVTAESTPVQTASSERSQVVDGAHLEAIGLKGRDPYQFLDLLPGVIDTNASRDLANQNSLGGIVINGQASNAQSHTVDGVQVTDNSNAATFITPNPDAISEISVLSSGFQAEFGRSAGGSINFITKSGTQAFHGSGHWDHRHEDFNANSFFNNRQGIARPIYRYMIAGYTIGGPIYIPKVFNTSKNKYFFFLSQEFVQVKSATTTQTPNLPTVAERTGDFSKSVNANGVLIPVINPATGAQFPGNIISPSLIDPTGQAMLNLLPKPNGYVNPAPGQQFSSNSLFSDSGFRRHRDTIMKFDASITSKLSAYYRLGFDADDNGTVFTVTSGTGQQVQAQPGKSHALHATYVLSPTLISETNFGFSHNTLVFYHPEGDTPYYRSSALNPPTLFPIPTGGTLPGGGPLGELPKYEPYLPAMTFGGGQTVGQPNFTPWNGGFFTPYANYARNGSFVEDLTKIWGNHRIKTGISITQEVKSEPQGGSNYPGNFNFSTTPNNPLDTGNAYSNALMGIFQIYQQSTARIYPIAKYWQNEGYIQDSWRVNKKLTVELGLRLVHQGVLKEVNGVTGNFYAEQYKRSAAVTLYRNGCKVALSPTGACSTANQVAVNPLNGTTTFNALVGTVVPNSGNIVNGINVNGRTGQSDYFSYPALVYAPRLGFAYDPFGNGKTAIRASGGVFYNRSGIQLPGQGIPPVLYTPQILYSRISDLPNLGSSAVFSPTGAAMFEPNLAVERAYVLNFSVQRDIGFNTVVDVGYVGNFNRHAPEGGFTNGGTPINSVPYQAYANPANVFNGTPINANFLRTAYPGMANINYVTNDVSSLNYHALQVSVQKRLSRGLFYSVAYTFSKALGTATTADVYHTGQPITTALGQTVTLPNRRQWFYGPLNTDRTQVLSISYSYVLPKLTNQWKPMKAVLGGWTISGITIASTGAPVSPSCTSSGAFPANDPTLTGGTARCQIVADPKAYTQSFTQNFNTAAFAMAPQGTWGNTGLGIFRQPSTINFDATLDKVIRVRERYTVRLRWQAFNVFNHTEFSQYGTTYSFNATGVNTNTTTGQYTTALNPRQQALTIRFEF